MNIFRAKWFFLKPERKKILIFDRNSEKAFKLFFKKNEYIILDRRGESLNIFVLFYTLIFDSLNCLLKNDFALLKLNYFKNYINFVNPKVVLNYIDVDFSFYQLKNLCFKPKFICVQNGIRDKEFFDRLKYFSKKKKLSLDYFFVLNSVYKKVISNFIKGHYIEIGSIFNNAYTLNKKKNKLKGISFISQKKYSRPFKPEEIELLKILIKFCKLKKIKINFITKMGLQHSSQLKNFKKIENLKIYYQTTIKNSYRLINKSEMVVFLSSTLGYEAFAKGIKSVCIPIISKKVVKNTFKPITFGYPGKFNKSGFFWTGLNNPKKIFKVLDNVYRCNLKKWNNVYKNYFPRIMNHDPGNKKFKKIITILLR